MNETTPRAKLFFGNKNGITADQLFGEWIEEHPKVKIIDFQYQHARYGDHSIAILYECEGCDKQETCEEKTGAYSVGPTW